jgi:hypothetical protein
VAVAATNQLSAHSTHAAWHVPRMNLARIVILDAILQRSLRIGGLSLRRA